MEFLRLARGRPAWTAAVAATAAVVVAAVCLGQGWQDHGSTSEAELPQPQPRLPPPRFGERIMVLSIDGGGIRGMIPTVVIDKLEKELQKLDGDDARIADYFDVIAGTSTGALIAAMLVTPKDEKTERPRTAEEIRHLYRELGPMIFPPMSWARKLQRMLCGPIYNPKPLHSKIKEITGNLTLDRTLTKILVPAFDVRRLFPRILHSYMPHGKDREGEIKPKLSDVCIATTAAPTYLPAHEFRAFLGYQRVPNNHKVGLFASYHLIDGGVGANNPTMEAIMKVASELLSGKNPDFPRLTNGVVDFTKYVVISIGTGSFKEEKTEMYTAKECAGWSAGHWGFDWWRQRSPIVDVFTQASNFLVDYNVAMLFHSHGCAKNYLRIQAMVDPSKNTLSMDNATEDNMNDLERIGRELLTTPLARVSKSTGMYETAEEPDSKEPRTNEDKLKDFAEILSTELGGRIKEKEREDALQAGVSSVTS